MIFSLLLKRFFEALVSLFIVVSVSFFLMHALPGSPLESDLQLDPAVQASISQHWGLQEPLAHQYFTYLTNIVQGDWGFSPRFPDVSLWSKFAEAFRVTLGLALGALVVVVSGSYFFSVLSFGSPLRERFLNAGILLTTSIPAIFLVPLLILVFSFHFNIFPAALLESPLHYVLPTIALSLRPMASLTRIFFDSLNAEGRQFYVRTAKAKGLSQGQIVRRHILRNSLSASLGYLPSLIMGLISGSFVIEVLFSIPGLASEIVSAFQERDLGFIVLSSTVLAGGWIVLTHLFDFLHRWLDPRLNDREAL